MQLRRRSVPVADPFIPSFRLAGALLAAGLLAFATNAWAQDATVYVGGSSARGAVDVDLSVLDDLDGARRGPSLLPPPGRAPGNQRLSLSPPGSATAQKPAAPRRAAPKPSSSGKAPTSKPAAMAGASASTPAPIASAPAGPAFAEPLPPPEPIDVATAMPPPRADSKPAPTSKIAAAEPAPGAPRDLKPVPASNSVAEPQPVPALARPAEPAHDISAVAAAASAPEPKAVPAAAPIAPPAPTQMAALQSQPLNASGGRQVRLPFSGDAVGLSEPAKGELKQIAGALSKDAAARVQVMAYASGSEDAGKARRLSLSRALAVRSYLIEQGIGSTRIDVRALGNTAEGGPADRVDLVMVSR